eukprot:2522647-Amphidinium_carterae.1
MFFQLPRSVAEGQEHRVRFPLLFPIGRNSFGHNYSRGYRIFGDCKRYWLQGHNYSDCGEVALLDILLAAG